jgi:hypothetical protein
MTISRNSGRSTPQPIERRAGARVDPSRAPATASRYPKREMMEKDGLIPL